MNYIVGFITVFVIAILMRTIGGFSMEETTFLFVLMIAIEQFAQGLEKKKKEDIEY